MKVLQRNFVIIERIGFVFASNAGNIKTFLDGQQFFMNEEPVSRPYSENVDFLISIIKEFKVKSIDFLACNTLNYSNWENYYGILTKETGVVIGASNDKTGNIKYGGDWIMESTSQNIELIYFTQSVEYYSYLLDNIPIWTTTGGWPMGSAISGGYLYVALNTSGRIGKISLTNPYGDNNQVWATTGTSPTYIAISSGYIYVANSGNNTIGKISLTNPSGDNNQVWATTGNFPNGVVISGGYIYVSNRTDNKIGKISLTNPSGDNNQVWATTGTGPQGLEISNGYIYVANSGNNTIGKISLTNPSGDNTQNWATTGTFPAGISISNGYIYVTNFSSNTVGKIDLTNPLSYNNQNWAITGVKPNSVIIDSGFVYVSNSNDNTISRFDLIPPVPPSRFFSMKPLFTDNSRVYYKPGSLASCGVGTVRNSSVRSKKI